MSEQSQLAALLGDAYRVEHILTGVLEGHAKAAKNHPQLKARLNEHLEQTKQHTRIVKGCLDRLDAQSSEPKNGVGSLLGLVQEALSGAADEETVVKNGIAAAAAEHFEIGLYTAIIAAADGADPETEHVCRAILGDEEEMAAWLAQHLPPLTQHYARQAVAGRA